jgi:plasmid stabilization system protein ParE
MLRLVFAEDAERDLELQADYYAYRVTRDLADQYVLSVQMTLRLLRERPKIGRACHYRHASLRDLREWRVDHPFERMLIYYRLEDDALVVFRIVAANRDRPRRLLDPPGAE